MFAGSLLLIRTHCASSELSFTLYELVAIVGFCRCCWYFHYFVWFRFFMRVGCWFYFILTRFCLSCLSCVWVSVRLFDCWLRCCCCCGHFLSVFHTSMTFCWIFSTSRLSCCCFCSCCVWSICFVVIVAVLVGREFVPH